MIASIVGGVLALVILIGLIFFNPRLFQWRSDALLAQATQFAEAGDTEQAARKAEAAYRLFPENLSALRLASISLAASDPATARRLTFELATSPFATAEDFRLILPTFEKLPTAEFDAFFNQLPRGVRADPALLNLLSERWFAENDLRKAADYAARSLQATPNPLIAVRLGLILADDPATQSESVPWLVQAIETGTAAEAFPAIEALTELPADKLASARLPESDALIKKFPNATPSQIFTLFRVDWQLHPDRHAAMWEQLAAWQKKLPRPELGLWLAGLNETERLVEWVTPKEALTDPVLFDYYARALLQTQRADELLALLPEAGPVSSEITNSLLAHFRKRVQTAQLTQLADQLYAQSPENEDYLNLSAYLNFLNGKVDDIQLKKIYTLLQTTPTNRRVRTTLALGYAQKGDIRGAFEILSAEPDTKTALTDSDKIVLARVWSKAGKMKKAQAFLTGLTTDALLPEEKNLLTQP